MKILFLVYHGFSEVSGITKKIRAQADGLRQGGHDVSLCYYDFSPSGHRCRYIDGHVVADYGTGLTAALRSRIDFGPILSYVASHGISLVYARSFQNASPFLIRFFSRLRRMGVAAVTEIPTYPYDSEFAGHPLKTRAGLLVDKLFRRSLARRMDAIVTFSDAEQIFGQRTIRISNGIDFHSVGIVSRKKPTEGDPVEIIAVAEVHFWHGFDRFIDGMGKYYAETEHPRNIIFHIVGGIADDELYGSSRSQGIQTLITKHRLESHVVLHGQLFGESLDQVFARACFAVGSLGRHRSGISVIKTLKNREYASRGLPFMYSEDDSDFNSQPYVMRVPADESPIDIRRTLDFISSVDMTPEQIRASIAHLSWKEQMAKVLEVLEKG